VAALRDELLARADKWDALLRERDEACLELAKLRELHARGDKNVKPSRDNEPRSLSLLRSASPTRCCTRWPQARA